MEIYRGDIFFVTGSGGRIGSEQKQDRPAIVVSNDKANEHSPVIEVVFLTSQEKSRYLPTHVDVMCQIPSVALCEQVNSISKSRLGDFIRSCTTKEMEMIDAALMISLGLTESTTETVEASEIATMLMQIKEFEEAFKREKEVCHMLQLELDEAKKELDGLKSDQHFNEEYDPVEVVKLQTERDTYKQQYEALLERILGLKMKYESGCKHE